MTLAQIKSKMPLEFIEEIYKNFSPRIADKILIGMSEKRLTTLRVNTIKFNMEDLLKILQEENTKFRYIYKLIHIFTKLIKYDSSYYFKS